MNYVITRLCQDCVDGDCLKVCPVDCILQHQPSDKPSELPNQLFIDPVDCIGCGVCVPECPWEAIYREDEVPEIFNSDIVLNTITRETPDEFAVPVIEEKPKPTNEEVEKNKQRWGLSKKPAA